MIRFNEFVPGDLLIGQLLSYRHIRSCYMIVARVRARVWLLPFNCGPIFRVNMAIIANDVRDGYYAHVSASNLTV